MKALKNFLLLLCFTTRAADYAGVGLVLKADGTNIVVNHILPDTPAANQKGIHVGDRILSVAQDKEPPVHVDENHKIAQVVSLIRGPKDTTVRLTIISPGEDESSARVVSFVRGTIDALAEWGDGTLLTNGIKAPDMNLTNLANAATEHLSDYTGKIIVLEFWASWCGPCQTKMAELQTYPDKFPDWKGKVVLIAASIDDVRVAATDDLKAHGWDQTHNVSVGIDARKAYHINAIPTAYVIGRFGMIVAANPRSIPDIVNHELKLRQ
jgi:thiol-disulfide isomerase/thioredoxin